jgi:hypothetical protein
MRPRAEAKRRQASRSFDERGWSGNHEINRFAANAVTIGAGFIGGFPCERLVEENQEVICIDNFYTGRRCNVAHSFGRPNFELLRHDMTMLLCIEVDQICNMAWSATAMSLSPKERG